MILDLNHFILTERPAWDELESILRKLEDSPFDRLSLEQTRRLIYLYDRAASDLLRVSTFASSPEVVRHLEGLVARAYGEIHETREPHRRFRFLPWFLRDLPRTFRRQINAFWLSLGLTVLGAAFGAGAIVLDPDSKESLMPFSHLLEKPSERVAHEEKAKGRELDGHKATFAASLMTHNIRVSLLTLALGMTFGIGTMIMLFYNGVMIGAVSADYILDGQSRFLVGWLLPHGSVEIPAVMLAGQAGFILASALFGSRRRLDFAGRFRAVRGDLTTLIGGLCLLLVWAGIIESFFSQYHEPVLPYGVKIGFGMVQLTALFSFLALAGRKRSPDEESP